MPCDKWIDVNERTPDEGIKVLTYMNEREYNIDYIFKLETEEIWACILDREQNQVTHWMPLPQPPTKKENRRKQERIVTNKWFVHTEFEDDDCQNYTITNNPYIRGWKTDGGYSQYGLPKELAESIVKILNDANFQCDWNASNFGWEKKNERNE